MEQEWLQHLIGLDLETIEGAFWTLFVEFKFYVLASLIYFGMGRKRLIPSLLVLSAWGLLAQWSVMHGYPFAQTLIGRIASALSFERFGWFTAGACLYRFVTDQQSRWAWFSLAITLVCSAFLRLGQWDVYAAMVGISCLFIASTFFKPLQKLLANRFLVWMGFISYPIYLMHENMMIATIIKLHKWGLDLPRFIYPALAVAPIAGLAYVVAKWIEPAITQKLKPWVLPKKSIHAHANAKAA